MIGVFTTALLTAEFRQVWAEQVCHDLTPQLWRKSDGGENQTVKGSIPGDSCNRDVTSR